MFGRKTVSILLAILLVLSWAATFLNIGTQSTQTGEKINYKQCIDDAEIYMSHGLFQKAAAEYKKAISKKNKEEDWEKLLNARQKRYEENENSLSVYLGDAKNAAKAFPSNIAFCTKVVELSIKNEDYQTAYDFMTQTKSAVETDDTFNTTYKKIKYSYTLGYDSFTDFRSLYNGMYYISKAGDWQAIRPDGTIVVSSQHSYMAPINTDNKYVCVNVNRGLIANTEGIIEGIFPFIPTDAGILNNELVPVSDGFKWVYCDLLGDPQLGDYEKASNFQDGFAVVRENGAWFIISTKGEKVHNKDGFSDIKIDSNNQYQHNGISLAKESDSYSFYDSSWKKITDFSCEDIDSVVSDFGTAFMQGGKWGFVDTKGQVIIEPQYDEAKSFSHGLAAVKQNGRWGFINTDNELVIEPIFLNADYFTPDGYCMVNTVGETWQIVHLNVSE